MLLAHTAEAHFEGHMRGTSMHRGGVLPCTGEEYKAVSREQGRLKSSHGTDGGEGG